MDRFDSRRKALAISLAGLAGFVDAAGFLSAGGYFISFMSGNTTRLAVNLARSPAEALTPALLILGFVAGVALGTMVNGRAMQRRKAAVLALVTGCLVFGALARMIEAPLASLAGMVFAMGALNTTFQRDGEIAVGLTYMTGALVKLGQAIGASLNGTPRSGWGSFLLLWAGLAGGAVLGATAHLVAPQLVLWIAVTWSGAMAIVALRLSAGSAV